MMLPGSAFIAAEELNKSLLVNFTIIFVQPIHLTIQKQGINNETSAAVKEN